MITHRQIALDIQRGRRFNHALKEATQAGPVTREQIHSIAQAHKIDKSIAENYIAFGILRAYVLRNARVQSEEVTVLEPQIMYLMFWNQQPDNELAFLAVMMTGISEKAEAFARFMQSCNLPHQSNCQRCLKPFASRMGKKYCSDKCRWLDHAYRKANSPQRLPLSERIARFLKSVRELL